MSGRLLGCGQECRRQKEAEERSQSEEQKPKRGARGHNHCVMAATIASWVMRGEWLKRRTTTLIYYKPINHPIMNVYTMNL
jgi:hypothetical protein